jgi:hypothetical protein
MNARKIFTLIFLAAIAMSCKDEPVPNDLNLYFEKGELSDDDWADSLGNLYATQQLTLMNEPSLKDGKSKHETLRLTVFPAIIYNPYCIKLEKLDSIYRVSVKIQSDSKTFRATGLNGLSLCYESNFERMDSIYVKITREMDQLDPFTLDNSTPAIVSQNKIGYADGTTYLLEFYSDGKHIALERWNGFLEKKYYKRSEEFERVVKIMHHRVPAGVLPDIEAAREPEDLKFGIFKTTPAGMADR